MIVIEHITLSVIIVDYLRSRVHQRFKLIEVHLRHVLHLDISLYAVPEDVRIELRGQPLPCLNRHTAAVSPDLLGLDLLSEALNDLGLNQGPIFACV